MTVQNLPYHRDLTPGAVAAPLIERARFAPGDIVRHRMFDFRGVVFDIDPVFANSEEWYQAIPEDIRPAKEQPYYHLFAENEDSSYIAYVSQQNLVADGDGGPIDHPQVDALFDGLEQGRYRVRAIDRH
ncbi:MAG: heat shock protein HspQ [Sphingopyxis sp.]|uniref:heat shock protein HspQ n=1 Tax=Sphingopyxis sp. TaxID=1908224 RepID=UPI002ABC9D28|nr:heat shock protein HspQ [Sphingopyxis sp.]MDZ3830841.1 heat shock protein HspQ [Sphingopyxis sp.]